MENENKKNTSKTQSMSANRFSMRLDEICSEDRHVCPKVLRHVIELAIEIFREGREGRKIGTMFVVGDEEKC